MRGKKTLVTSSTEERQEIILIQFGVSNEFNLLKLLITLRKLDMNKMNLISHLILYEQYIYSPESHIRNFINHFNKGSRTIVLSFSSRIIWMREFFIYTTNIFMLISIFCSNLPEHTHTHSYMYIQYIYTYMCIVNIYILIHVYTCYTYI